MATVTFVSKYGGCFLYTLLILLLRDARCVSAFHPSVSTSASQKNWYKTTIHFASSPITKRTRRDAQVSEVGDGGGTSSVTTVELNGDKMQDWYGAPSFDAKSVDVPREFRKLVRSGTFSGPTNARCPGFLQCNLVVLPQEEAFDFLLFCQRNNKACPLIEVCEVGSPCPIGVAPGADLRTDIPMYSIYRDGEWVEDRSDVTDIWPDNSVAFLIGCSFTYDGALADAGIPLRSAEQGKGVPIYKSNLKCRSAGRFSGNIVVSMKPIPTSKLSKHIEITSKYTHAHGGPVSIGNPEEIGIADLSKPEWGDPVEVRADEVPVFHACGVTPQSVLMDSKVPFAITHKAGHMFVTDLPCDLGIVQS